MNAPSTSVANVATQTHPAKLVSLLALAGGAVALPQTGLADIIYTDLSSTPKSIGFFGDASYAFVVPGTAQVGLRFLQTQRTTTEFDLPVDYRSVLAGALIATFSGGVRAAGGFAANAPLGATWDQGAASQFDAPVAWAGNIMVGNNPGTGYNNRYMSWYFRDTVQANALRYGWAEISLTVAGYGAGGPTVTLHRYAYDNTGAKPTMGLVPEPSSAALLVIGAMALGSRGLRKWRQDRQPANQA